MATLRDSFDVKGAKESITETLAKSATPAHLDKVAKFVDDKMALCKQHIYIFAHEGDAELPDSFAGAERIVSAKDHALYVTKRRFEVVKLDPPATDRIDFIWPIRIELQPKYILVRFVVLEKNISAHFEREIMVRSKTPSEEAMTASLLSAGTLSSADINRGIKSLWSQDLIDASRLKFDMPDSADSKNMHEAKGLKKTNQAVYLEVKKRPLRMCTFTGYGVHANVGNFSVNPTEGFIGFTRYAKEGSSGDELIRQILSSN